MAKKENFYSDNPDIRFHLENRIDWEKVFAWTTEEERELSACTNAEEMKAMAMDVLDTFGDICGSVIAPNAQEVEKHDLVLKDGEVIVPEVLQKNMAALVEFGIAGLGCPPEFGGMGAPFFLEVCANEMMMRACPSTGLNAVWYSAIAHIIDRFGNEEIRAEVLPKIAAGEWSGCMALTEPDAGSDLAALRTYGEKQEDGSYLISGTKQFISNGNGQVALVLAMNKKGATGLKNINLLMCMRKIDGKDNYKVTKLEEKVALHGSATCELTFDNSVGFLLGEEGKGFNAMLELMNDARIATGYQGLGLMEAAYRLAADFASERKTWGKPIAQHELIAEKLLDMEVMIKAVRSLCYQAGFNQSVMYLGRRYAKTHDLSDAERADVDKEVYKSMKRVRRWTPLIKWYVGEKSFQVARDALQIHGGYGFTKEYRAEWWVRESLILAIYEGTSQIQALMCVKDTMKEVIRDPKKFLEGALGYRVKALSHTDPIRKKLYKLKQLENGSVMSIMLRLLKANMKSSIQDIKPTEFAKMVKALSRDLVKMNNIRPALLHAERLCEIRSLVALSECLVWDAETDASREWLAERMLNQSLIRVEALKNEIEMDEPVLDRRLAQFDQEGEGQSEAVSG